MTRFTVPNSRSLDPLGAFMAHAPYALTGYSQNPPDGPLFGLTVGIKDLFDVEGLRTGGGSPVILAGVRDAAEHAPVVAALINAGAQFVGKTLTDELAWSLNGENAHYGTPINPFAAGRVPGGSSAGSAAAVAGGLVDFALGSDTGGSVRLPASYCGIWGLRPTHGRVDIGGAMALAPSFDTVGWFAKTADLMTRVGQVLLPADGTDAPVARLLVAQDMFARVDESLRDDLLAVASRLARRLEHPLETITLAAPDAGLGDLEAWRQVFRICQSAEAWDVHGAWVLAEKPTFGPGIKERFAYAAALTGTQVEEAKAKREAIANYLNGLITPGTLLVVPGAAGVAPLRGLQGAVLDDIRNRALEVLCPSGLGRLPQLVMPALATLDGPVGLGLIAWSRGDEALLAVGQKLERL